MQTLLKLQKGELKGAVSLKLSENLSQFPKEIFELADTLEVLDLSKNNLDSLPADFGRLYKLRILFCSDNQFTILPEVLADCPLLDIVGFKANIIEKVPARSLNPNIRWLILTNNNIDTIPAEIGNCTRMQKLMLAGNRLTELPDALQSCRNLALLRIAANRFTQLPGWLLNMPKLAWLAFSGNQIFTKPVVPSLEVINWENLELAHLLGEGASGIILKAYWNFGNGVKEVAVKVFKGAVTSDGLPEDEMDTCVTAGQHYGMVKLIAQIGAHPEDKKGLVMELIPASFFNLGLPPSFETCSRDVFEPGINLSAKQIVKIAITIASVARQLHSKGIVHGDMYAHNTLIDNNGNTLFGDFGAAGFYDKADALTASLLQRIEVRAFGYLLDDLLTLSNDAGTNTALIKVAQIKDECLNSDVALRPDFEHINEELQSIS